MTEIDPLTLDFAARHPDSFARALGRGGVDDVAGLVDRLPPERRAAIVARLPGPHVRRLLDTDEHRPADWLVSASFDDAVSLLSRVPRERRLALINGLDDRNRKQQLLRNQQYPSHSVGALVGDVPLRLSAETPASEVLAELREIGPGDPGPIVVVDGSGRYVGVLDRWQLLVKHPTAGQVGDYVIEIRAVRPESSVTAVAIDPQWHTRNWLPVIDHRQRVLGSVTREKVFRAAEDLTGSGLRSGDVLIDLLTDLLHAFGAVLERVLSRKTAT